MSLRDFWYIACESRELKAKPRAVTVFGEALVLWRERDGKVGVLLDRCAHRNAPLSKGSVVDGCIQCPYHGWRFDTEGVCAHIPALADGRQIPASARVPAWRVCEQDGYIWVFPGNGEPANPPRRFPHFEEEGWTSFRMKTRFESNVEACLENFLDCPHTAHVHRGWFRNPDTREVIALVRRKADGVEIEFENEPETGSLISRLLYPSKGRLRHTDQFLMPNFSRVDYEWDSDHHFIITSQCTPISELKTDVYTVITFRYGRVAPFIRLFFEPMSRRIIGQDVKILALHGQQLRRFGGENYAHAESDLIGLQLQAMRRRSERGESEAAGEFERKISLRF